MSKYKNQKCEYDGITFDSKRELSRYCELKVLLKAGAIRNLELQVPFKIEVNGMHICKYICDFMYSENGKTVIEDVKSEITSKLPVYRLKKALMKAVHGIEIIEA